MSAYPRDKDPVLERVGPQLFRAVALALGVLILAPALLTFVGPVIAAF